MKKIIVVLSLLLSGCAAHKVSLVELREYDQAIQIAEKNGVDTKTMREHLVEMLMSYLKDPGEDPYQKAARDASNAMQWNAAAAMIQATNTNPVYYQAPPMSPMEYQRAVTGR